MSKEYTKEETIQNKKAAIRLLNNLLESYINDPSGSHLKKANLISRWVSNYTNYICFEDRFNPAKNISYKRGDIVFVNFGFNIGAELGGNHYAVVVDNKNRHNSSTVVVVPLCSRKANKDIYERDIDLGNELHDKLKLKLKTQLSHLLDELSECIAMQNVIREAMDKRTEQDIEVEKLEKISDDLAKKQDNLKKEIASTKKVQTELAKLKLGSVAKTEQIRTISKMRIYNPRSKHDPLYGIHFTDTTMEKINSKLKELFIFAE